MSAIFQRQWLLPLGVMLGYALLMGTNPVRHPLLDGIRSIRRYHRLWLIPAGLGLCYALFHAALALFFYRVLPIEQRPAFGWRLSWAIPPWTSHLSGGPHPSRLARRLLRRSPLAGPPRRRPRWHRGIGRPLQ